MAQEMTFKTEADVNRARREDINAGRQVSLMAFDPTRDLYVYDRIS